MKEKTINTMQNKQISNNKHYCVAVDKVVQAFQYDEVTMHNIISKEHEGVIRLNDYLLVKSTQKEAEIKQFEYCYTIIVISNIPQTIGFLYWGSHNVTLQDVYIKILNERLYDTADLDLKEIGNSLGLTMKNLPYIDIAVDFDFDVINTIYDLWKDDDFDTIILDKHRDKNEYISEILNTGKGSLIKPYSHKGFYIKNRDKAHKLELCAYDKGLEIDTEKPYKRYIRDCEGFGDKIYRLEVRTTRKTLETTLDALNINKQRFYKEVLNNQEELFRVWEHLFQRLLRFRKHNARNSERFIDLLKNYPRRRRRMNIIDRVIHKFTNSHERTLRA